MTNSKPLHSAVTAFLYLLSLVTLGFTAFAIGDILFSLITKYVPDPLLDNTAWAYRDLKFSIASLIITAPLFIVLANYIQKYIKSERISLESQVRKWLSFVTIFIASCVIIGVLIGIIVNYLDGNLSLRMFLELAVVLAISTMILLYNIFDIRRQDVPKKNVLRLVFNSVVIPLAVISLIIAFFLVESPTQARSRRIDEKTMDTMSQIKSVMENYYFNNKNLPNDLDTLKNQGDKYYIYAEDFNTIDKDHSITYERLENNRYKMCADFLLSSEQIKNVSYNTYTLEMFPHNAGNNCFTYELKADPNGYTISERK
ncbi:MAG TPA: DUF5671 domain-containing protein [bacterium]|nr:DUF5671 domain-containing protein [bacterium]